MSFLSGRCRSWRPNFPSVSDTQPTVLDECVSQPVEANMRLHIHPPPEQKEMRLKWTCTLLA